MGFCSKYCWYKVMLNGVSSASGGLYSWRWTSNDRKSSCHGHCDKNYHGYDRGIIEMCSNCSISMCTYSKIIEPSFVWGKKKLK